ncbi:NCS1 family nucleobase:cation symporter-1 [Phyllosticta capitalensis]|uniref:NCS1 family nucleobase:cation symporter-1 n=1 Tax=Phyllosticta capitalensis TaxID=121624 RepID=A0ABR1YKZ1_9PEZI
MAPHIDKERVGYWAKRLECPVDENSSYRNTYWCNRDLIPMPEDRRTWTWQGYAGYWTIAGINTTAWTAGSTLLSLGLSVPQSIGVMVGVALISALIAVVAGWPGSHLYLGFTVLQRASWGMRGGFWPVLNRIMTACVWMGIQAYWGGQAMKIILRALIGPKFVHMKNTLPASANLDTASCISFFVFIFVFLPLPMIPPEKLQLPFRITFIMITVTMFGMLAWSVHTAGGPGELFYTGSTKHGSTLSWNAVFGLQSIIGSQASGCLGQSDWTRYAKNYNSALFGQFLAAPVFIIVTSVCGILITSASATIYGEYIWNPFELLLEVQKRDPSGSSQRAGTFFAGLGFLVSQLALCQMLNGVSTGMDMAALCPKWINIRRGCYILTVIAIAICPWNYVVNPGTFITVLSGWSVFLSPMTGIVVSDYFLVRFGEYHIGDMYMGNKKSCYWYWHGFNWRAFAAWLLGMAPLLPGFARAIQKKSSGNGWDRLYEISYFYGFFMALFAHAAFHAIFPAERQRGSSPFVLEGVAEMIHGEERSTEGSTKENESEVHKIGEVATGKSFAV